MAVDLVDALDIPVGPGRRGRRGRIRHVLPVEHHVVGRERLAVVPGDVLLELPGHRQPVLGHLPVLETRHLGGQDRHDVAVRVIGGQGLVEDAGGDLVLGADGEVWIQEGRRLPEQDLDRAAATALRGGERRDRLRPRHARGAQDLRRQRRRQAQADHRLHERAPRQAARLHLVRECPDLSLVHRTASLVVNAG
jgi:hypothetical protein